MLSKIEKAVLKAGEHLLKGFNGTKEVSLKGKIDLVTQYDVEVERILLNELSFIGGEYGFVAEESAAGRTEKKKAVYIDPIDGTTNFVHGFPFCCISVGVYNGSEGEYGIVYNPVMNELFKAEAGGGAFLNGERIHCSVKTRAVDCLTATGFPYGIAEGKGGDILKILERILANTRGIRRAGSAALDLCYTARGVFDAYYEFNLSPWDIAGGAVIAREAGCVVSGMKQGESPDLYEKFILAASEGVHGEFLSIIKNI
ncbi:inositol monophosphatase family protein [Seleniivibrio woodruffii]|uniref:inositol monophosphatase family protein n=1 Tax=Seleniivibrio woodruffii TaxID=1078050 RepID=UPI0039E66484